MPDDSAQLAAPLLKQAMQAVTREALQPQRNPRALASRYVGLAQVLEADARWDEAANAWQAAAVHAPDQRQALLAEAQRCLPFALRDTGIIGEHARYLRERARCLQYPSHVRIETLATCNAACVFCPYPRMERKGTRMDDAMLDKILRDLTDIPRDHRFGLSFHHISEAFIDKRFGGLLRRAERELPQAYIVINTNASALNATQIDLLCEVGNIGELNLSFNDHREQDYEQTMKLPYRRSLANIDALHAAAEQGRLTARTFLRRVGDGSATDREFVAFCRARWPRFAAVSKLVKDFLGQIEQGPSGAPIETLAYTEVPVMGCLQWTQMTITAEGRLAVCCFDGKAEWPIADIAGRHLLEVYNSPEFRRFRDGSFTRLEAPEPCASCSIFWSGRKMNTTGA